MKSASLSPLELYILGYLNKKPAYGYEIYQYLQQNPMPWIYAKGNLSVSTIYYVLHNLHSQSLLVSRTVTGSKAPERECFRISAKGKRCLEDMVNSSINERRKALHALCVQYSQQLQGMYWLQAIQDHAFGSQPHRPSQSAQPNRASFANG